MFVYILLAAFLITEVSLSALWWLKRSTRICSDWCVCLTFVNEIINKHELCVTPGFITPEGPTAGSS